MRLCEAFVPKRSAPPLSPVERHTTPVDRLFGGTLLTQVECTTCGAASRTQQPFQHLQVSVDLPNLSQCIPRLFDRPERLSGWRCPQCRRLRGATKSIRLAELPPVLVVVLNRFAVNGRSGAISKNTRAVQLPPVLRLAAGGESHTAFCLRSVVCHAGPRTTSGHYYAYVRGRAAGRWFRCNDDRVSEAPAHAVMADRNAYIAFFEHTPEGNRSPAPENAVGEGIRGLARTPRRHKAGKRARRVLGSPSPRNDYLSPRTPRRRHKARRRRNR